MHEFPCQARRICFLNRSRSSRDIKIYENSRGQCLDTLDLAETEDERCGPFVWGRGHTKGWLFASSEIPDDGQNFRCHHRAFDVEHDDWFKMPIGNEDSAGDAIAITVDGTFHSFPLHAVSLY
jgi:hypothetical protein